MPLIFLAFDLLLQQMQIVFELFIRVSFRCYFFARVDNRGMITSAKELTKFREAFFGQFTRKVDGNLSRPHQLCFSGF